MLTLPTPEFSPRAVELDTKEHLLFEVCPGLVDPVRNRVRPRRASGAGGEIEAMMRSVPCHRPRR